MIKKIIVQSSFCCLREAALVVHSVLGCSQGVGGRLPHSALWPTERELLVVNNVKEIKKCACAREVQRDICLGC